MKSLITGITGFAGSHLAEYLLSEGDEVFGIKRVRSPLDNIKNIMNQIELFDCNLMDPVSIRRVLKAVAPDKIFHLAAQSYVKASWDDPVHTMRNNIEGQMNIFNALIDLGMNPIIQIAGSSEEYGNVAEKDIPIRETCPLLPLSPYAVSKVAQDLMGYQYHQSYGLNVIRTRAFNHTGPRRGEVFATSSFAKQVALIEARKQEPIIKHGNLEAIRDFTDVRDTVRAYDMLTEQGNAATGEVYNICSNNGWSIGVVLDFLIKHSTVEVKTEVDESRLRPSDLPILKGDNSKLIEATGWAPQYNMEQTLVDLLDYWRNEIAKISKG